MTLKLCSCRMSAALAPNKESRNQADYQHRSAYWVFDSKYHWCDSPVAPPPVSSNDLARQAGKRFSWDYPKLKEFIRAVLKENPRLTETQLARRVEKRVGCPLASARGAVQRARWRKLGPAQRGES